MKKQKKEIAVNFYKFIIFVTFFQSFLCAAMDTPAIIAAAQEELEEEETEPINLRTFDEYFVNPEKKLQFSDKSTERIKAMVFAIKEKKAPKAIILQKQEQPAPIKNIQQQKQKTPDAQKPDSQEIILHKSKIPSPIPQNRIQKNQTVLQPQPIQKSQKKNKSSNLQNPINQNESLHLLNIFRHKLDFQTIGEIGPWLWDLYQLHKNSPQYNDPIKGPCLNVPLHTLVVPIKKDATCIYSQCHRMFTAVSRDFSEVITWGPQKLHPNLFCNEDCTNYHYCNKTQENQLKILKHRLGIPEEEDPDTALFKLCMGLIRYPECNNPRLGIFFDTEKHTLIIKIGDTACMYSPCKHVIAGIPYTFEEIITMKPEDLNPRATCGKDCPNHQYSVTQASLASLFSDK